MRQIRLGWQALGRAMCLMFALRTIIAVAQVGPGQWQAPAADLARQIAGVTGPGSISLSVKSASSIGADDAARIEAMLVKELAGAGVQVRTGTDVADAVRVTLSQSARQGVWVGEVQQGPEVRVVMVSVPLPQGAVKTHDSEVVLNRKLLLSRAEPVLDAQWQVGTGMLIVLGAEDVTFYSQGSGGGALAKTASFSLEHNRPFPRDIRGRMEVNEQGWKAYLPGVVCVGVVANEVQPAKAASCAESDDPWPLGERRALFHAGRNFFTGITMPSLSADAGPFYSEADVSDGRGGLSVISLVRGGFRVVDGGISRPLSGTRDWGSDIAPINTGCGSGVQVLASANGDADQDALMAYEIDRTQAVPVSAAMALDGRVLAMWPPTHADGSAMVITERIEPRSYEVYRVTATCGS